MKTCAIDPTPEPTDPSPVECSLAVLTIAHAKGQSPKFVNASKQLLYIYADLDGDGDVDRAPLFDTSLEDFFWDYDNHGQRLAQLRFYPCPTTVPDPEDGGPGRELLHRSGATPTSSSRSSLRRGGGTHGRRPPRRSAGDLELAENVVQRGLEVGRGAALADDQRELERPGGKLLRARPGQDDRARGTRPRYSTGLVPRTSMIGTRR